MPIGSTWMSALGIAWASAARMPLRSRFHGDVVADDLVALGIEEEHAGLPDRHADQIGAAGRADDRIGDLGIGHQHVLDVARHVDDRPICRCRADIGRELVSLLTRSTTRVPLGRCFRPDLHAERPLSRRVDSEVASIASRAIQRGAAPASISPSCDPSRSFDRRGRAHAVANHVDATAVARCHLVGLSHRA